MKRMRIIVLFLKTLSERSGGRMAGAVMHLSYFLSANFISFHPPRRLV